IRCGTRPWTSLRARRACPGSRQATRRPRRAASRWFRPPWQTLIANGNDEMRAVLQHGVATRRRGRISARKFSVATRCCNTASHSSRGTARAPRASSRPRARRSGSCAPTARRYTRPARARRHDRARGSRMEQVCERVGALALLWLATAAAAAPLVWLARRAPPAQGALDAFLGGGGFGADRLGARAAARALLWRAPGPAAAPLVWLARRAPPAECALDAFMVGGVVAAGAVLADATAAPRGADVKPKK